MKSTEKHWNTIFSKTEDSALGWYEKDLTKTFSLLNKIDQWGSASIFISGAGTSTLIDELLVQKNTKLILNDISTKALNKVKERLAANNKNIYWLNQDISQPIYNTLPSIDIWIDRAVLHFILDENGINGYFNNLKSKLAINGYAIFAEFSIDGAKQCAGLKIQQYSVELLSKRLGSSFQLVTHFNHIYTNPNGDEKPYIYALYKRVSV